MKLGEMVTTGAPWHHPYKAVNVRCFDGKRRTVRLNQQADTFFSWPGRCTINGKTVRGYVTGIETEDRPDLEFRLYDSSWARLGIEKPDTI